MLNEINFFKKGVDSVKRQTGAHVEFENEWEGAFNLQIKISEVFGPFLEWCFVKVS